MGADARRGDYATVTDESDTINVETSADRVHLRHNGRRIGHIPCEDVHRDQTAIGSAEDAIDLCLAPRAITVMAKPRQRAETSFEITAG